MDTTNNETTFRRPQRAHRLLKNLRLIWLDANFNDLNDNFKAMIQYVQRVMPLITHFTDADECIEFIKEISDEKVFIIASGYFGKYIVQIIHSYPQVKSIYILCGNQSIHKKWTKNIHKVKGVYTEIEPICKALQIEKENNDREVAVSVSGIDPLFLYTQLMKEAIMDVEDDDSKS
ncbi:unnamed protein product, partial [Rotaria sp. Silwood2]